MLLIDFLLEPSRLGWGYWNAGPYNSKVGSSKYVFTSNVLLTNAMEHVQKILQCIAMVMVLRNI